MLDGSMSWGSVAEWLSLVAVLPVFFGAFVWLRRNTTIGETLAKWLGKTKRQTWHRVHFRNGWGVHKNVRYKAATPEPVPDVFTPYVSFKVYGLASDPVGTLEFTISQQSLDVTLIADTHENRWGRARALISGGKQYFAEWRLHEFCNRLELNDLKLALQSGEARFLLKAREVEARELFNALRCAGGHQLRIDLVLELGAPHIAERAGVPTRARLGEFDVSEVFRTPAQRRFEEIEHIRAAAALIWPYANY